MACLFLAGSAQAQHDAYCAPYFDQPDTVQANSSCATLASPEDLVAQSSYFTLGDVFTASQPTQAWVGGAVTTCKSDSTPTDDVAYRARVHGGVSIYPSRMELVPVPLMSSAGFSPSFLLDTATAWSTVTGFFTGDSSAACGGVPGTCTWSDNFNSRSTAIFSSPYRLRDYIDGAGGDYRTKVYYIPDDAITAYYPTAAVADLGNASYRAWRVAEAQRLIATGAWSMVMLNHKFCQWRFGQQGWLGGTMVNKCGETAQTVDTVSKLQNAGAELFSAEPTGYWWTEYVQGWAALADDLKAAGVPFAVYLDSGYWLSTSTYDDPATAGVNEATLITDTAENDATLVIMDKGSTGRGGALSIIKRLEAAGRRVLLVDQVCGQYGTNMVWGTPTTRARIPVNTAPGPNR